MECFQTCSLPPVLALAIQAVIVAPHDYVTWGITVQSCQAWVPFSMSLWGFFHIFRKPISDGFCPTLPVDASHWGNGSDGSGPLMPVVRLQMLMALSWLPRGTFVHRAKLQM